MWMYIVLNVDVYSQCVYECVCACVFYALFIWLSTTTYNIIEYIEYFNIISVWLNCNQDSKK